MDQKTNGEAQAVSGQTAAGKAVDMEEMIFSVQDLVFNLSLRMLGTFADAEDASQEILLKVITHFSSFRGESAFSTWVFRIAVNYLKNYKKHMFAQQPLSFEYYGSDIENGRAPDTPDLTQNVETSILAEELKLSCTNVLLQCLDTQSRCIFILGTMFRLDSCIAGELLGMSAEAYRQRLSRIRKKMSAFLEKYCEEYGNGKCKCEKRLNYAIQSHRLHPAQLEYTSACEIPTQTIASVKNAMEEIDELSRQFSFCKTYQSPESIRQFIKKFLNSESLSAVQKP